MTPAQADQILATNPDLCDAIGTAMIQAELPGVHRDTAARCGAYLFGSGWIARQQEITGDPGGWAIADEVIEKRTGQAIKELQAKGLLSAGLFSWFLAVGFRWAITAFVEHLIRRWLIDGLEAGSIEGAGDVTDDENIER